MEITLTIDKSAVMEEVAQTTSYTGAKMGGDVEDALKRISTVDEDETQLERFWNESRADICQELIGLVSFEGMVNDELVITPRGLSPSDLVNPPVQATTKHYELRLNVSNSFDTTLQPSMEISLFSYFVQSIASKWYVYTNKAEAGDYADKAHTLLDDVHRKAVYKKKPTRPTY